MTTRIWSFAAVGSASHWSAGPPAAEMSAKLIAGRAEIGPTAPTGPWMFHLHRASGRASIFGVRSPKGHARARVCVVREVRAAGGAREADAVRLHAVANERGHRDAAVLDLSVAEPADGLRRALADVERIPEANRRVELLGELLEASSVRDLARGPRLGLDGELVGEATHLHRHAAGGHHGGRIGSGSKGSNLRTQRSGLCRRRREPAYMFRSADYSLATGAWHGAGGCPKSQLALGRSDSGSKRRRGAASHREHDSEGR